MTVTAATTDQSRLDVTRFAFRVSRGLHRRIEGWIAHNVKLLHVHYAAATVNEGAVVYLCDISVAREDVLLRLVRVLVLIKFLAH